MGARPSPGRARSCRRSSPRWPPPSDRLSALQRCNIDPVSVAGPLNGAEVGKAPGTRDRVLGVVLFGPRLVAGAAGTAAALVQTIGELPTIVQSLASLDSHVREMTED